MIKLIDLEKDKQKRYKLIYEENGEKKDCLIHIDIVIKYNLLNQETLDTKQFKAMIQENAYTETFMHAVHLLAKKPYARKALFKAIKGMHNLSIINQVLDELETLGYLNERKTVEYIVNEMMEYDLVGPNYIFTKLEKEGYEETLIKKALTQYNESKEYRKCHQFLEKIGNTMRPEPIDKMLFKLKTKAYQKGFNLDIIDQVLNELKSVLKENTDEEQLLKETLERLKKRYNINDPKEKNKLIQKLMRDGFHYSMIKNMME